jgi:hypothetical protein
MTTQAQLVTIVEKPSVLLALAAIVEEQVRNLHQVEAKFKAGLYTDKESFCEDLEDANDSHIIACVAYHAALQLIKGKRINKEQTSTLQTALCMTGSL